CRECISIKQKQHKKLAAQKACHRGHDHGGVSDQLDHGGKKFKDPHVWKNEASHPSVATSKKHVAVGPESIQQPLVPPRPLSRQRSQVTRHLSPASGVGNKVDVVVLALFLHVPVQAHHQVEILSDGMSAVALDFSNQVGAENSECPRYDRQCIELRPGFAPNQKGAQVFNHLHDLYAAARQFNLPQFALEYSASVQHAHDPADGHNPVWLREHAGHDTQDRIFFQDGVGVNHADIWT